MRIDYGSRRNFSIYASENKETPEERSNTTTKTTSNASSENSTTSEKAWLRG